ncbi:hypothetical protein CHUAL_004476 [Chamberlinius hualienensis]
MSLRKRFSLQPTRSVDDPSSEEHVADFNFLKERCQVQPKRLEVRGLSSPPLPFLTSQEVPLRRASTCSMQIPRLMSVDEERGATIAERRGSAQFFRCVSPIIRAISPEGSPTIVSEGGGSPGRSMSAEGRPPLTPSRSLSIEVSSPGIHPGGSPEPRSPLRATSPDLRSNSPSPDHRSLGSRARPLSPMLFPKSPSLVTDDAGATSPVAGSSVGIDINLYQKKDTILMATPGGTGVSHLGRLHFRLKYDYQRSDLIVHVIEAHDLVSSENGGFNDPYVKLSLMPQVDTKSRQTKILRKSANPYFNEVFKFPVAQEDLAEKSLLLQVFDFDKYSRNDVVGEILLHMSDVDVTSDLEVWSEIKKNKKPKGDAPELLFSLSYLPSAERLTVVVLKAQNLNLACSSDENPNPFVKVYLLHDGRRQKKRKTSIRRSSYNPVWNEAMTFNVPSSSLSQASLELKLFNADQTLGSCSVGSNEPGLGELHWSDMMQNTRKSVAMWHSLK